MNKNKSLKALKLLALIAVIGAAAGFGVTPHVSNMIPSEAGAESTAAGGQRQIFVEGRVEAIEGSIDVMPQLSGELLEVYVTEGKHVRQGDLLAVIDARREAAQVAVLEGGLKVARAELDRVLAGSGEEEIQAAGRKVEAAQALVDASRARVERLKQLAEDTQQRVARPSGASESNGTPAIPASYTAHAAQLPDVEEAEFQLLALKKECEAAREHYEALRRGPLPEDVQAARAAVELAEKRLEEAKTNHGYHRVVAPISGTVLKVYRHAGDSVQAGAPTPVVSIADTDRLRIRLEAQEVEAHELAIGKEGVFTVRGRSENAGRLRIQKIVPVFDDRQQFQPNTSARTDTRVLPVLCEVISRDVRLHLNQRITAEFVAD